MLGKIPARYIGEHEVLLSKHGGPYFDGSGMPKFDLLLHKGDTLMMPETEVCGMTVLHDLRHESDDIYIGAGKVILPEHVNKNDDELSQLGYQFHQGRQDFEPYVVQPSVPTVVEKRKKDAIDANSTY